jgi:type IV secretion system protein VirB5
VVRASETSFQARWLEKTYQQGALTGVRRFTGLFTIVQETPRSTEALRTNPLGIYIHSLNWGEDLVTGDSP